MMNRTDQWFDIEHAYNEVVIHWSVVRRGATPQVPSPDDALFGIGGLVFVSGRRSAAVLVPRGDGGYDHVMAGVYIYAKEDDGPVPTYVEKDR